MDIDHLDSLDIELPQEFDGLPVFAVGGAVRDTIRGVPFTDVDLMVAEVSPSEMESRGFRRIDSPNNETFGVFQDSRQREVALAREEESTGDGHKDFEVTPVASSVEAGEAVQRDLKRRDLTVNAMAFDLRWDTLIDPHDGVSDLRDGVIRAVSHDAFRQDPLRVLRAARFAARLDAQIDDTTLGAMWESAERLDELPQERVRMELEKTFAQVDEPSRFFNALDDASALNVAFPELAELTHVPAGPPSFHSEGSAFEHTMLVLDEMNKLRPNDELALLMALAHDLGKGTTPDESLPSHPGHGNSGVPIVTAMSERLGMSNTQSRAMIEACRFHMRFHEIESLRESTVVQMWLDMNHVSRLIALASADGRGREPRRDVSREDITRRLSAAQKACDEWTGSRLIEEGHDPDEMGGENFGNLLHQKRVERMRELEQ